MDGDDLSFVPEEPHEPPPVDEDPGLGLGRDALDDDRFLPPRPGSDPEGPGPGTGPDDDAADLEPDGGDHGVEGPGSGDHHDPVGGSLVPGGPAEGGDGGASQVELPSAGDGEGVGVVERSPVSTTDAPEAISLDTDVPLTTDTGPVAPGDDADIDLSTSPDAGLDPDGTSDGAGIVLPVDDGGSLEPYVVAEGNGVLDDLVMAAGLTIVGAAAAVPILRRAGVVAPQDTVALLDSLGIDARVEHGDVVELEDRLAAGGAVLLAADGTAGVEVERVLHLDAVDREAGMVRLRDQRGRRRAVPLERFEAVWADSANQLIVAVGDGRSAALLPLLLDDADFAGTR